jgi:hypothetical protein
MAKFAEATKGMAPEMQNAAAAVVAFKPQIDALKKDRAGQLLGRTSPGRSRSSATRYLPILTPGLGDRPDMGGVAFSALEAMNTPFFTGAVGSILQSTPGFGNLGTALGDVLTGIVGIGRSAPSTCPRLGEVDRGRREPVRRVGVLVEGQNQIKAWIDTGIQAFSDLFAIIGNIGSTLVLGVHRAGWAPSRTRSGDRRADRRRSPTLAASAEGSRCSQALGAAMQAAGLIMPGRCSCRAERLGAGPLSRWPRW